MEKTKINTEQISNDRTVNKTDVTYMMVYNYGDAPIQLIHTGVVFEIPAFDAVTKHARGFEIAAGDGTCSDVEFDLEFDKTRTGKVVLVYKDLLIKKC